MKEKVVQSKEESNDWSNQKITNRFMFNKVFTTNSEACRRLLEILLGIKIVKIKKPQGEYTIESNIENRGVRFDVFTEDNKHLYDIEMQTVEETDLPERVRYYQGMMDVDSLKTGEPYSKLKNSVVIFICTFNPFKNAEAKAVRIFKNIDIEDKQTELNDRTKKVFFNVKNYDKIQNNNELKGLLKFFAKNKAETEFTKTLTNLVNLARKNERWRQDYMTYERWQYYERQHGIKEGEAIGIAKQKAEDEKLLRQTVAQKDAEVARQAKRIAELEALLKDKRS